MLDSPFSNLKEMTIERTSEKTMIPEFIISSVFHFIRSTVKEKAFYDIDKLDLFKFIPFCRQPAIFLTSVDDFLVQPENVESLF